MGNVLLGGNDEIFTPTQEIINPKETIITNLQAGHGFIKVGDPGTLSDDTDDFIVGNQSLKFITDGAGGSCTARVTGLTAIDMTGKYIKLWLKLSSITNCKQYSFYLSSDDFSNYYTWQIGATIEQLTGEDWVPITLSFSDAVATGTPNRAAIVAIQWRVVDKNNTAITSWLGSISAFLEADEGMCSIAFDDGSDTVYSKAMLKMSQYGMKGTVYIIPDYIDWVGQPYMTLNNLKDLYNLGWDISGHYQTNLTTLSLSQVNSVIINVKKYLTENGFARSASDFAIPNGAYTEDILTIIKKYFRSARNSNDYRETLPPADYYRIRCMFIHDETSTADIATAVSNAILHKEWLILVFHRIVTSPAIDTEYSITNFDTVIDNLYASKIKVLPVSSVINSIPYLLNKSKSARRWIKPFQSDIAATSQEYTAGRVLMQLFEVVEPCYVDGIGLVNGATADGNLTVGITRVVTEEVGTGSTVVVESASTAQSGTGTPQFIPFTPTFLKAGRYYACVESDSNSATYMRIGNQTQVVGWTGYYNRDEGYGALTNPTPSWTLSGSNIPAIYVRCKPIQ